MIVLIILEIIIRTKVQTHRHKNFCSSRADMICIIENIFEDGNWVILEWKDPLGLRGCCFFQIQNGKIIFQRGYWDKISFLRMHNLPIPIEKKKN